MNDWICGGANFVASFGEIENVAKAFALQHEVVLVGNPVRLASGGESGDAHADGRRSHIAVDCPDQLVSLEGAA